MELQTLTYLVVGATFALYIGIAVWAKASTTGDFYVAGKGVHPVLNGMATGADWMSAASFISMAGLIAEVQKEISYAQPPQALLSREGRRYRDVSSDVGKDFLRPLVARGLAVLGIQGRGRLIGDDDGGRSDERTGRGHTLLLPP